MADLSEVPFHAPCGCTLLLNVNVLSAEDRIGQIVRHESENPMPETYVCEHGYTYGPDLIEADATFDAEVQSRIDVLKLGYAEGRNQPDYDFEGPVRR